MTEEEVFLAFLSVFEGTTTTDGIVTKEEFVEYYNNLSAGIDNDEYFQLMISRAWGL